MAVFPLQGFSLADVQALRFVQEPSPAGGPRWVHLYAATLFLLVVLPRLVLSLVAAWRAAPHRTQLPDRPRPAVFSHRWPTASALPVPAVLRVIPYSFTVDEARHKGLASRAAMVLGEQAQLMLRPASPYGEEAQESLRDVRLDDADVAVSAVLFNLAATPEKENHGAFLDYLVRHTPRGVPCWSTSRAWPNAARASTSASPCGASSAATTAPAPRSSICCSRINIRSSWARA
jgi:hypothetical protein